jgi:Rnl2 family RNA ligase
MNHLSEYEKMPSGLKELVPDELTFYRLNKLDWVVTEKVHGANFRFIYQDKKLQFGKRKELLSWTDDFFGFQTMVVRLERQIIELLEQVQLEYNSKKIIVYGELFGGTYPHSGVPVNSNISAIQTGIFYSPNIEFYAFDISIENENPSVKCYLDYQKALSYFENFNILHASPLKLGKLSEVLNFDLRMETTIPQYLNLPAINGNFIEGIVIKPFNYSPTALFEIRPIIKIKNPEFEENRKFHQAQKWSYKTNIVSFSQDLDFLLDYLRNYITENRLRMCWGIENIGDRINFVVTKLQRCEQTVFETDRSPMGGNFVFFRFKTKKKIRPSRSHECFTFHSSHWLSMAEFAVQLA